MNSININVFVGNLTRDAELSYTNSGFAISKMSIAINRSKKVGEQWEDETSYFDLVGLGKRYETLNQYLTRGSKIAVECHAKQERWEKDGQKRSKVVFIIDNIELVGGKSQDAVRNGQETAQRDDTIAKTKAVFEDDIPF
jgi:single-strand DNA-binding protein